MDFKERLIEAGASETVFDAVNRQLSGHGYMARGGQMIDASIVQTPKQSIKKEERDLVAAQAIPADWSPAKRRQKDVAARWTKKHGKSYFGYKLSASADKRYKLIRKIKIRTASEHDTLLFEAVIDPSNTSGDIYADKGYVNGERGARLKSQGWRMHIQRKGNKDKPLSEVQERRNRRIASPRSRRACLRRTGATGSQNVALDRSGTRHASSELDSGGLQLAPLCLFQGGRDRGVLTPEVRPDCRNGQIRIAKYAPKQAGWRRHRFLGRYIFIARPKSPIIRGARSGRTMTVWTLQWL